jgi:hypothetical protein
MGTLIQAGQVPVARLPRVHTIQGICRIGTTRSRLFGILLGTELCIRLRTLMKETHRQAEWRIALSLRGIVAGRLIDRAPHVRYDVQEACQT